jgi:hypothetical protein
MPLLIDSAPDCITHVEKANADDLADFILQDNYKDCGGIMTFGPGTTYGDGGASAATSYYVLTWIGIAVMVAVFVMWVVFENRTLISYALRNPLGGKADDVPPQPGMTQ